MNIQFGKAVLAGIIGTLVMTAVGLHVAPLMGLPAMNPAAMLAEPMGGSVAAGWVGHLTIGSVLAVLYAAMAPRLSGAPWMRGATFSILPWLLAQLVVMPMMGMPLFSGAASIAIGSLVGHLVYGATVGAIYGAPASGA